jgi:hypothetical protein
MWKYNKIDIKINLFVFIKLLANILTIHTLNHILFRDKIDDYLIIT